MLFKVFFPARETERENERELVELAELTLIIVECQIVPLGVDYINQGEGSNISPGCCRGSKQSTLHTKKGHKMTISVA